MLGVVASGGTRLWRVLGERGGSEGVVLVGREGGEVGVDRL